MGVKNMIKKAAQKAGDGVAKLSSLSPEQLKKVQDKRDEYLMEMPDPTDSTSSEHTNRLLGAGAVEIYNAYLKQLKQLYVPVKADEEYETLFNPKYNIRFLNITKWIVDKKEDNLEKLINVYKVLSTEECNIALIFNRTKTKTNVYLSVTNTKNANNNVDVESYIQRLKDAIKGNFPGSTWSSEHGIGTLPCLDNEIPYSVACTSNIPAEKSEKFISQTIEKLLDGIIPSSITQEYTIILLASPNQNIEAEKLQLSAQYSALAPYSSWQTNFTYTESDSTSSSATVGVNVGASVGSQNGTNQSTNTGETLTDTTSTSDSHSQSHSKGTNESVSDTTGSSDTVGGSMGLKVAAVNYSHTENRSTSTSTGSSVTDSLTSGITNTAGKSISKTVGSAVGSTLSKSLGANFGANFSRSSTVTATIGKNEGITQSYTNYTIKHTLELLEQQMKRYEQSSALGMWDFGAYVIGEDKDIVNNVAHSYVALTQGEESYLSDSTINLWRGDLGVNSLDAKEICNYLRQLRHPIFGLNPSVVDNDSSFLVYPPIVNSTTSLSGKELSYALNFPQKSVSGLPVIKCAEFGRSINTYDVIDESQPQLKLGHIFHMNHKEDVPVSLNIKSLASHTFITGSTGSGKSNTVYQILNEAMKNDIKFMVIEPAKGEYKHAYSFDEDINVYGTNPKITPLLRINPFSFPSNIHVLEHIDRLVEIFNVCWPMYAAMPAVLKKAVEDSYSECGWNLTTSINEYNDTYYPTFKDICKNIKVIIDSSEYDNENKGAYKGALLTRLESLTNGIYGMIFTSDEISNTDLFDENVIVDLSRVGSSETKTLLMGMLVLKLQEHRMSSYSGMNEPLKHITVLEEAHNLLKRTSTEQSGDSANLLGKSVEMLGNAIAEMRTYGEGFIIADQAPGLLDMATIRNTNTKIIMRLPDLSDRELVGRAANLDDDQIMELAKLPLGVAAVYQNEWIEPVLCKVKKARVSKTLYKNNSDEFVIQKNKVADCIAVARALSQGVVIEDEVIFKEKIDALQIRDALKVNIIKLIDNPPKVDKITLLAPIMSALFPSVKNALVDGYKNSDNPQDWTSAVQNELNKLISNQVARRIHRDIAQAIITEHILHEKNNIADLEKWHNKGGLR